MAIFVYLTIFVSRFCCPPAWPRYRVLRVQDLGQYNLEILSADLSDDSLYECQAPDAALRSRRAKLTVLSVFPLPPCSMFACFQKRQSLDFSAVLSCPSPPGRPCDRRRSGGAAERRRVLQPELRVSRSQAAFYHRVAQRWSACGGRCQYHCKSNGKNSMPDS